MQQCQSITSDVGGENGIKSHIGSDRDNGSNSEHDSDSGNDTDSSSSSDGGSCMSMSFIMSFKNTFSFCSYYISTSGDPKKRHLFR